MKKSTITFLSIIFGLQLFAQGTWDIISPTPTINDLHDVYFVNSQTGWAVGAKGTIVATKDGGQTWEMQYKNDGQYFTGVFFIDENEGWVVGWHDVLHTENGGDTWEEQYLPGFLDAEKLYFINPDTGWIVGTYKTIYKTVDGGETWVTKLAGGPSDPALVDLYFSDALHGIAAGGDWFSYEDDAFILVTSDGGETWTETTPQNADEIISISFVSQDTGWACGYGNDILKTVDGGYTWEIVYSANGTKDDIQFINSNEGIVLSSYDILTTNDGGVTWTAVPNTFSDINSFSFSGSTGFAAGYHGRLYKTTDFGLNWSETGSNRFGSADKLTFIDPLNGWAKKSVGVSLLHTNDGGYTWENISVGATYILADYCFPTANTGYAMEYQDRFFKTTDGGENWDMINIPFTGDFLVLDFVNELKGFIGGNSGLLLMTLDGGQNWQQISGIVNGIVKDIYFINENKGWILTKDGNIYSTEDGGNNWSSHLIGVSGIYYDLYFLNEQKGFATNLSGKLYMTEDGGNVWNQVFTFSQYSNRAKLTFANESEGWLIVGSRLYYTINGGYNWVEDIHPEYMLDVCFLDSSTGWISGSNSLIMKYENQITNTGIFETEGFKVFPNPTLGNVNLLIPEMKGRHKMLNIYDASGKLCRSLNITDITGEVRIDISTLQKGMYLFEMKSPDKSMVVKVFKSE